MTHQSSRIHYHTSISSLSSLNIDSYFDSTVSLTTSSSHLHSSSLLIDTALLQQFDNSNTSLATTLGYIVGIASLLLYTPIVIRILRTQSASGLALSTWYCKVLSFTCTDVYNIRNGFPVAAFSETVVITIEALMVLLLVTYYQKKWDDNTVGMGIVYVLLTAWALLAPNTLDTGSSSWGPSPTVLAAAQIMATLLNSAALLPQLHQNMTRKSSGGYSPITAMLGSAGCTIRLYTTELLAHGDVLMMCNYGVALVLNMCILMQVVYFGMKEEKKSFESLFLADLR
eukprot:scaffold5629_cov48-Cyclotella_meneghiniana.AAC.3